MSKKSLLLKTVSASLGDKTFIKIILSSPISQSGTRKVTARVVQLKDEDMFSVVSSSKTKDITKNYSISDGLNTMRSLLKTSFNNATLFTSQKDYQLEKSKSGLEKIHETPPTIKTVPAKTHDHSKKRLVAQESPFLAAIGITTAEGEIKTKMTGKYKQTESFINILNTALKENALLEKETLHIYDMGAGSGYISFAIYDYIANTLQKNIKLIGVDTNEPLVIKNNQIAHELGFAGISFAASSIEDIGAIKADVVIALHACNTATDDALYAGIQSGAQILIVSPCCHQEIRKKMKTPKVLQPMLKFGTNLEREAEMLTDTIRTLILETHGYKTNLFEFVSDDHSGKNNIIVAVKKQSNQDKNRYIKQLSAIKEFYTIEGQVYFESLFK
jgi:hypothetical protein